MLKTILLVKDKAMNNLCYKCHRKLNPHISKTCYESRKSLRDYSYELCITCYKSKGSNYKEILIIIAILFSASLMFVPQIFK